MNKADHVRKAVQTRPHECHWPGCTKQVKPALWGCSKHWFSLPESIRNAIWATYRIGQEERLDPSDAYVRAARMAQDWIMANHPPSAAGRPPASLQGELL